MAGWIAAGAAAAIAVMLAGPAWSAEIRLSVVENSTGIRFSTDTGKPNIIGRTLEPIRGQRLVYDIPFFTDPDSGDVSDMTFTPSQYQNPSDLQWYAVRPEDHSEYGGVITLRFIEDASKFEVANDNRRQEIVLGAEAGEPIRLMLVLSGEGSDIVAELWWLDFKGDPRQ